MVPLKIVTISGEGKCAVFLAFLLQTTILKAFLTKFFDVSLYTDDTASDNGRALWNMMQDMVRDIAGLWTCAISAGSISSAVLQSIPQQINMLNGVPMSTLLVERLDLRLSSYIVELLWTGR